MPEEQSRLPQQSRLPSALLQLPPEPWQQRLFTGEARQLYPLGQQLGAAAPGVHSADGVRLHVAAARQVPLMHSRLPQQSRLPSALLHVPPEL